MADPFVGHMKQPFADLRMMGEGAHEDEQRDDCQRVIGSGGEGKGLQPIEQKSQVFHHDDAKGAGQGQGGKDWRAECHENEDEADCQ
nr:hypothetical protein [Rhizobium sp. Root651]